MPKGKKKKKDKGKKKGKGRDSALGKEEGQKSFLPPGASDKEVVLRKE